MLEWLPAEMVGFILYEVWGGVVRKISHEHVLESCEGDFCFKKLFTD